MFSSANLNYKEGNAVIEWFITHNTSTTVHVMDDYASLDSSTITENKYAVRPTIL